MNKRLIIAAALILLTAFFPGCTGTVSRPDNYPYEPDTSAPDAHNGRFVSEHGSMTFNGDGKSVDIEIDAYLAGLTGLPEGESSAEYVFLSGDLPPHGSVRVRYLLAHEISLTAGGRSAVITLGIAAEDGSGAVVGTGVVTGDRIPLLFSENGRSFTVFFLREGERE